MTFPDWQTLRDHAADRYHWWKAMRLYRRLQRMTEPELDAHVDRLLRKHGLR